MTYPQSIILLTNPGSAWWDRSSLFLWDQLGQLTGIGKSLCDISLFLCSQAGLPVRWKLRQAVTHDFDSSPYRLPPCHLGFFTAWLLDSNRKHPKKQGETGTVSPLLGSFCLAVTEPRFKGREHRPHWEQHQRIWVLVL